MFLNKNYKTYILQPNLDLYKEWDETLLTHDYSLQMNNICPFDLPYVNTKVFLTYLLSLKREYGTFFTFFATMVNNQHLCISYLNLAANLMMMKH